MIDIVFYDAHITLGMFPAMPCEYEQDFVTATKRLNDCGIFSGLMEHRQSWENTPGFGHSLLDRELTGQSGFRPVWNMLPFDKNDNNIIREFGKKMIDAKVAGALLLPGPCSFSPDEWCAGSLYSLLEDMRMPLFIKMNAGDIDFNMLSKILANHPRLPVILRNVSYQADHMLYPLMNAHANIFVETCGYKTFDGIGALCKEFGCERLIFGSNYPYESPGSAIAQLLLSDLPPDDIAMLAGKNMLNIVEGINYDI